MELLKEVAGTKVYEDRRAEALKNIQEAETKRTKVEELLEVIDERLAELEEEKEELKEFSTKDKERRCLEYSIYQRELSEVTNKLNEVCLFLDWSFPVTHYGRKDRRRASQHHQHGQRIQRRFPGPSTRNSGRRGAAE